MAHKVLGRGFCCVNKRSVYWTQESGTIVPIVFPSNWDNCSTVASKISSQNPCCSNLAFPFRYTSRKSMFGFRVSHGYRVRTRTCGLLIWKPATLARIMNRPPAYASGCHLTDQTDEIATPWIQNDKQHFATQLASICHGNDGRLGLITRRQSLCPCRQRSSLG